MEDRSKLTDFVITHLQEDPVEGAGSPYYVFLSPDESTFDAALKIQDGEVIGIGMAQGSAVPGISIRRAR